MTEQELDYAVIDLIRAASIQHVIATNMVREGPVPSVDALMYAFATIKAADIIRQAIEDA